jgi:hypothetical protein
MVFDKRLKIAFVLPTKTGSTALRCYLKEYGFFRLQEKHGTVDELIKLYPNLVNYSIYGFFRNPLERFESGILYAKQHRVFSQVVAKRVANLGITKSLEEISYEEIINNFLKLFGENLILFNPQVNWLKHPKVTALDYHNMQAELTRVVATFDEPMPVMNKSNDFGRSIITDKVKNFVRDYYAADYQFAKDVLGKEY